MNVLINKFPEVDKFYENDINWVQLKEPSMRNMQIVSTAMALLIPLFIYVALADTLNINYMDAKALIKGDRLVSLSIFILIFVIHELIHAFAHPNRGLSDETTIILFPYKLMGVAYYTGQMSKNNFLYCLLAPFFFLTILPLCYCFFSFNLTVFLIALANASMSSADIFNFFIVLKNAPKKSVMKNYGYYSYCKQS